MNLIIKTKDGKESFVNCRPEMATATLAGIAPWGWGSRYTLEQDKTEQSWPEQVRVIVSALNRPEQQAGLWE